MEQSINDIMLLLSLVHLQLPLPHQILCRRLGLVKKHGVERAGVMNFLRPETLEILWCPVPLSQISKTEFSSVLCSCCSHISAFCVPCHCVLWNDADLSAARSFITKHFQCTHLQPLTPVIRVAASCCNGLWLWETLYQLSEPQLHVFKGAYW